MDGPSDPPPRHSLLPPPGAVATAAAPVRVSSLRSPQTVPVNRTCTCACFRKWRRTVRSTSQLAFVTKRVCKRRPRAPHRAAHAAELRPLSLSCVCPVVLVLPPSDVSSFRLSQHVLGAPRPRPPPCWARSQRADGTRLSLPATGPRSPRFSPLARSTTGLQVRARRKPGSGVVSDRDLAR